MVAVPALLRAEVANWQSALQEDLLWPKSVFGNSQQLLPFNRRGEGEQNGRRVELEWHPPVPGGEQVCCNDSCIHAWISLFILLMKKNESLADLSKGTHANYLRFRNALFFCFKVHVNNCPLTGSYLTVIILPSVPMRT